MILYHCCRSLRAKTQWDHDRLSSLVVLVPKTKRLRQCTVLQVKHILRSLQETSCQQETTILLFLEFIVSQKEVLKIIKVYRRHFCLQGQNAKLNRFSSWDWQGRGEPVIVPGSVPIPPKIYEKLACMCSSQHKGLPRLSWAPVIIKIPQQFETKLQELKRGCFDECWAWDMDDLNVEVLCSDYPTIVYWKLLSHTICGSSGWR